MNGRSGLPCARVRGETTRKGSPDPDAGNNPKVQRACNIRPTRMRKSLEMRRGRQNIFPGCQTARMPPLKEDRGPDVWVSGASTTGSAGVDRVSPRLVATIFVPGLRDPWVHRADPGSLADHSIIQSACQPTLTVNVRSSTDASLDVGGLASVVDRQQCIHKVQRSFWSAGIAMRFMCMYGWIANEKETQYISSTQACATRALASSS